MNDKKKLLLSLKKLAEQGPVLPRVCSANAVGVTLQEHLGIQHNTTRRNSLFNYTVSATTTLTGTSGKTNLFACVADWSLSTLKSSKALVETYGREDFARGYAKSLFCTTSSAGPNSFGLYLEVDPAIPSLEERSLCDGIDQSVVAWDVERLQTKLGALGKSAIVSALKVDLNGQTAYQYRYVDLLGEPSVGAFFDLLLNGMITVDHCISMKPKKAAREQGPLFKVRADCRDELYASIERYDLLEV